MNTSNLRRALLAASLALLSACAGAPAAPHSANVPLRLLALNDLHGQISAGRTLDKRPVGGAAVLAAWLHEAERSAPGTSLIVSSGDMVSASPLASSLLRDEPTIMFLNQLGNADCRFDDRLAPRCNLVGTLGNHEFDHGVAELKRLALGGTASDGPFLEDPWRGARYPLVSANVVDAQSGKPILPPYVIKQIPYKAADGALRLIPIAFVGATLRDTPAIVVPSGVAGVRFLDEAEAINHYVPELQAKGVRAIVVLLHQGGSQSPYQGGTDSAKAPLEGAAIRDIVSRLDDEIDVVCAAHSHAFTNTLVPSASGKPILVTEAWSYSMAFAQIDLMLDPTSGDVVAKTALIQPAWADTGLAPDAAAAALVARAEERVGPIANRLITRIAADITRETLRDGESALGRLVADAQREAGESDFAFMNSGGMRNDLRANKPHPASEPAGALSFADVQSVQPFGNTLVRMSLSGEQIYALLESQFSPQGVRLRSLHVSGLSYRWKPTQAGKKVVAVFKDGKPIERSARYSVTTNNFLAEGGDHFVEFAQGRDKRTVGTDLDALIEYLGHHTQSGMLSLPVGEARVVKE